MEHRDGRVDQEHRVGLESEERYEVSGTLIPAGRGIVGINGRALERKGAISR
jgi:hypothetical protein